MSYTPCDWLIVMSLYTHDIIGAELHDRLLKQRAQEMESERKRPSKEVCACVSVYTQVCIATVCVCVYVCVACGTYISALSVSIHLGATVLLRFEAEWDRVWNDIR